MNRRDFLLATSAAAGGSAAASGAAAAQEGNASDGGNGTSGNATGAGGNQTGGNQTGGNQTGGNQTGGNQSAAGGGGGTTQEVAVGPGGQLVFEPAELSISPGTAVRFVWESGGHNVNPDEGDWGHQPIEDEGFSFTTPPFSETGEFPYVCDPHASAGMEGTIVVQEGGGGGGGGGEEEPSPEEMGVPFQAHFVGIATVLMMVVSLIYTFFLVKYGESPNAKGGN